MDHPPPLDPIGDDEPTRLHVVNPIARAFGDYELILKMGAGGMATLYLGRVTGPDGFEKFVAIKKIHDHLTDEQRFVDMFVDEARIASQIHHPNVVEIFELGRINNVYFISMEHVHGHDFRQLLAAIQKSDHNNLGWRIAATIVAQAASGLHAAHELTNANGENLGVVHRDVSPANVLISYGGDVKVIDFGIAMAAERLSQTTTGTLKGKISYMSPEQATGGKVDRRTDVFALGILLFESTCMRRLFRGENDAITLQRLLTADIPRPSGYDPTIPPRLEWIIMKALSRRAEDRFSTAKEMSHALSKLLLEEASDESFPQLTDLMQELFSDKKVERDADIHIASQETVISDITDKVSTLAPREEYIIRRDGFGAIPGVSSGRPNRRKLLAGLVIGGVISVVLGSIAYFELRSGGVERSVNGGASSVANKPSKRVQLVFYVTPKDASLHLDGKKISNDQGKYKRIVPLLRGERPVTILVSAKGYASKESRLLPVKDQTFTLSLERSIVPPRPKAMIPKTMRPPPMRRITRPRRRVQPPRRRTTGMRSGTGAIEF